MTRAPARSGRGFEQKNRVRLVQDAVFDQETASVQCPRDGFDVGFAERCRSIVRSSGTKNCPPGVFSFPRKKNPDDDDDADALLPGWKCVFEVRRTKKKTNRRREGIIIIIIRLGFRAAIIRGTRHTEAGPPMQRTRELPRQQPACLSEARQPALVVGRGSCRGVGEHGARSSWTALTLAHSLHSRGWALGRARAAPPPLGDRLAASVSARVSVARYWRRWSRPSVGRSGSLMMVTVASAATSSGGCASRCLCALSRPCSWSRLFPRYSNRATVPSAFFRITSCRHRDFPHTAKVTTAVAEDRREN